jgi:V/A-type H+-transporting ATPase subunit E
MSEEKIIEQIKKDSETEVKQIQREAENQVKSILETAKRETKIEAEKILNNGMKKSENLKKILVSKANQDVKRDIMNARETIIEKCFTKAHHELSILKGENYEKLVRKLIKDGQEKLGGGYTVLVTRAVDKKIAKDLGINITGTVESSGGVVLKSADGKVTLDHTFDGILKRERNKIRIKVGKLLFL